MSIESIFSNWAFWHRKSRAVLYSKMIWHTIVFIMMVVGLASTDSGAVAAFLALILVISIINFIYTAKTLWEKRSPSYKGDDEYLKLSQFFRARRIRAFENAIKIQERKKLTADDLCTDEPPFSQYFMRETEGRKYTRLIGILNDKDFMPTITKLMVYCESINNYIEEAVKNHPDDSVNAQYNAAAEMALVALYLEKSFEYISAKVRLMQKCVGPEFNDDFYKKNIGAVYKKFNRTWSLDLKSLKNALPSKALHEKEICQMPVPDCQWTEQDVTYTGRMYNGYFLPLRLFLEIATKNDSPAMQKMIIALLVDLARNMSAGDKSIYFACQQEGHEDAHIAVGGKGGHYIFAQHLLELGFAQKMPPLVDADKQSGITIQIVPGKLPFIIKVLQHAHHEPQAAVH